MYTASLDNGLRIIFQPSESEVVYCGYVICAGTRHEAPEDSGMAHFIEHMSFKGTQRRKSRKSSERLWLCPFRSTIKSRGRVIYAS